MECKEFVEYISAFIDGELEGTIESSVRQHFEVCPRCQRETEIERITKNLISHKLPRLYAPDATLSSIRQQIEKEAALRFSLRGILDALLEQLTWRTVFAIGGAAVIIFFLTFIPFRTHHSHAQPEDNGIIHQTYNNFDGVLDGKLATEVSSNDPAVVRSFLANRVNFDPKIPRPKRCRLIGGMHSHYKSIHLVHLVYQNDNGLIYLYQTPLQAINGQQILGISPEIKNELLQTGWHVESHRPDCCLIMWITDSTVFCAVGDMDKNQLLTSFKESE